MAELAGYLCWTPGAAVSRISTEAVIPSSALFLATHTPLRISRARLVQRSLVDSNDMVDEHAVLDEFMTRSTDSGALMMPLVGESGSGKSHLVRWVREHLDAEPHQKVIYLEKTKTSLKAVLESLLSDVEDPSLEGLKREVSSFSSSVDDAALGRRIVNSLNETLAGIKSTDVTGDARGLVGPNGLAVILQDPLFQEYLLKPGGFISRLAQQLLHDSGEAFAERQRGFTLDDLPLNVKDVQLAAAKSKRLVGLINTKSGLKETSIGLLNEHLESALRSAANLAVGRLTDAFLKVRAVYQSQGREILLLIEDFALIQGVQRELLDALTEPAVREGEARLAPIRTLMAVTTGYFTDVLPETALTRVSAASGGRVFRLDVTFDHSADESEQISSFTGRYLNVARVRGDLRDHSEDQLTRNQCDDCPFNSKCHEQFGTSPEGYGLYPFNRSALARMVHSTADKPGAFVPRAVLGKVVRPILVDHAKSIQGGSFPDEAARARFPRAADDRHLDTKIAEIVDEQNEHDAERHKFILDFWQDAPLDLSSVNVDLLHTLNVRPTATPTAGRGTTPKRKSSPIQQPSPRTAVVRQHSRRTDLIENWAGRGDDLDQGVARDLRKIIGEAVLRRFLWLDPPMREWGKTVAEKAWPVNAKTVSIEDAYGEKISDDAPIRFDRKASHSQFFQGLLRDQPRAVDMRKLASVAESNQVEFAKAIEKYGEVSDDQLVIGVRAALIGATLAGRACPGMDEANLLAVVLDKGEGWRLRDLESRTPAWRDALDSHLKERPNLVQVLLTTLGVAQGTSGEIRMIDAARTLPLLRRAADWTWQPDSKPTWVKGIVGFGNLDKWVAGQVAYLEAKLYRIRELLPEQGSGAKTVEAVRGALEEAPKVGLSPSQEESSRLRELLRAADTIDWRSVNAVAADLRKFTEVDVGSDRRRMDAIKVAAIDRGPDLDLALEFLTAADRWLTPKLAEAINRKSTAGDAAAQAVQEALENWSSLGAEGNRP